MVQNRQTPRLARHRVLLGALALSATTLGGAQAIAQAAPTGPIEITSGTSPGGTPDVLMRRAAKILNEEKIVANPIVVQNRTGGSWTVAANWVLGKKGDPNTVLTIAQPIITTPITQGQPTVYDKITPIGMFIQGDLLIVAQPNSPAKNLKEFVELAKQRERGVKVAGAQAGSTDHMVTGLVEKAGGVKLNYIPFDGGGAAQTAFLGGNVDMIVLPPGEALPLIKSNKAKALAVLSEQRLANPEFKDLPTAKEQGFNVIWGQAWGLAGPPDMDPALVKYWDDAIQKLVATDAWKAAMKDMFLRSEVVPASKAKAHFAQMHNEHLALLRDLGLAKEPAK
jgi:putative tricarboxylic transport membrane protein